MMKSYPSIQNSTGKNFTEFVAFVFNKLDGSNLRFEWNKKSGWGKYGTRHRLFDESDEVFGGAISTFHEIYADELEKIAKKNNWQQIVAYAEFWGKESFAGLHQPNDPKFLNLIDVDVYKKCIIGPKQFLDYFGHLPIAKFLGQYK